MAKTAAERQKEYRAQRQFTGEDGNGERRISPYVRTRAALTLDRLANRYGITKREMLEPLVVSAEDKLLGGMTSESTEWEKVFLLIAVLQGRGKQCLAERGEFSPAIQKRRHGRLFVTA